MMPGAAYPEKGGNELSNKKCVREKYLYLSAMLRAREAKMLTRDKVERMIDAPSFDEAAKDAHRLRI